MKCMKCGRELTDDEVGMHKKMVHRSATEFMCLTCLAEFYQCSEELLHKKMEQFRASGCVLFATTPDAMPRE